MMPNPKKTPKPFLLEPNPKKTVVPNLKKIFRTRKHLFQRFYVLNEIQAGYRVEASPQQTLPYCCMFSHN
jgi:hypothetical protein